MTTTSQWQIYYTAYLANKPAPTIVKKNAADPKPTGVMRPALATQAVLGVFKANPSQFYSRWALIWSLGCTAKSIDWACRYLVARGLIEATSCDPRNPRFFQYRLGDGRHNSAKTLAPQTETSTHLVTSEAAPKPHTKFQRYCALRRTGVSNALAKAEVLPDFAQKQNAKAESSLLAEPPESDGRFGAEQIQSAPASAPVEATSLLRRGKAHGQKTMRSCFSIKTSGNF